MKTISLMVAAVLMAGLLRAQEAPALTAAQLAGQAAAAKVLAIQDNQKAAEALTDAVKEMIKDEQAVKDGVPELTIAALVKSDPARAPQILPLFFAAVPDFAQLDLFERLMASALQAAGDATAALMQAVLEAMAGKGRWLEAAMVVAKDSGKPLPIALQSAIQIIPAVVLPPAVIPPRYEGQ